MARRKKNNPNWTPRDTRRKRTKEQRVGDRVIVANMLLEGKSVYEIRDAINELRQYDISHGQVQYDKNVIIKEWVEHYLSDINEMKAKELARIDRIERAAWKAWEKSQQTLSKTETEKIENEQSGRDDKVYQKHRKVRAKKTEQERDPDKKFLEVVQWCVETRCKILGINAPQRYDISWRKQAAAAGLDPDAVVDDLTKQFVAAAEKGLGNGQ